jgi:hypothetical protein
MMSMRRTEYTLWLFRDRLSLSAHYCPMWRRGGLAFWDNGGRKENECLDLNACIGRWSLSLTLWQIRGWSRLLRFIPTGKNGRGLSLGWYPEGAIAE